MPPTKSRKTPRKAKSPRSKRKTSTNNTRLPDAVGLVTKMMEIPGSSGQEEAVAEYITQQLVKFGADAAAIQFDKAHRKTPIKGQVGNLIFRLPGTIRGPRRLLMAHMDTVPICVGCQPVMKSGFIRSADPTTGLGADNRAGCAVVLHNALRLLREKPDHPPTTFLWTVQEEIGLHGARQVRISALGKPKLAFNWDGGNPCKLTVGATGGYRLQIDVQGIASHAGNAPEQGVSAIAIACLAIADLQANGWHGLVIKNGRRGTTNIGVIRGGEATNVVTDAVMLRAEARSHDPKFRQQIIRQIERAFERAAKCVRNDKGKTGRVSFDGRLDYEAFELKPDEPSVIAAKAAVQAAGGQPITQITNGGVDANWMFVHGIPTVTLGCGQKNPHMVTEGLDVSEFKQACEIGWHLATRTI